MTTHDQEFKGSGAGLDPINEEDSFFSACYDTNDVVGSNGAISLSLPRPNDPAITIPVPVPSIEASSFPRTIPNPSSTQNP